MDSGELSERTKKFTIQIIKFVDGLKQSTAVNVLSKQIVRSSTSIGANYRTACCARSKAEFIAKLQIARDESDETLYWLEIFSEIIGQNRIKDFITECDELTAILTAALKLRGLINKSSIFHLKPSIFRPYRLEA